MHKSELNLEDIISSEEEEVMEEYEEHEPRRPLPQELCSEEAKNEQNRRMERARNRIKAREMKNIWENCCAEVKEEMQELDAILQQLGLPPHNYCKDKTFPLTDYTEAPNMEQCKSKDYLDFYVFPYLLPAIQALILFARQNRVFQCRVCTFNPSDFISEFLYNSNPRHPTRQTNPVPLMEAPFAKKWLQNYPRPPMPKWLTMSEDEAAGIIQRVVRGFFVRKREDVQEMRQFWRDLKKEKEEERRCQLRLRKESKIVEKEEPKYPSEVTEDQIDSDLPPGTLLSKPVMKSHSEECEICSRFNKLLKDDPVTNKRPEENFPYSSKPEQDHDDDDDTNKLFVKNKYNFCCFHPTGHLPHTNELDTKTHNQDKLRPPSSSSGYVSCVKKPRVLESKSSLKKTRPHSHLNYYEPNHGVKVSHTLSSSSPQQATLNNGQQQSHPPSLDETQLVKTLSATNLRNIVTEHRQTNI